MKVAVLLYLYNQNLVSEYCKLLDPVSDYIHLFLSICEDNEKEQDYIQNILDNTSIKYTISVVPNKGLDIGPFLQQIKSIDHTEYSSFIKLHSKQSLWGYYKNIDWRIPLVNSLIGNKRIFLENFNTIVNNKHIGMIGNTGFMLGRDKEWHNSELIKNIAKTFLNISDEEIDRSDLSFIAGSIFWSKTSLFQKYFSTDIIDRIYALLETNKFTDRSYPTYAHSLERLFGYIVQLSGLQIVNGFTDDVITISNENNEPYNIVRCYNNRCYLDIDVLISGIYYRVNDSLLINWKHKSTHGFWKKYTRITHSHYIS